MCCTIICEQEATLNRIVDVEQYTRVCLVLPAQKIFFSELVLI